MYEICAVKFWLYADDLPEADMIMGFQNYSSLPRHLRGMLGLSPELDPAMHSANARTQVSQLSASIQAADCMLVTAAFVWRLAH